MKKNGIDERPGVDLVLVLVVVLAVVLVVFLTAELWMTHYGPHR